jgi:hypothetical protein
MGINDFFEIDRSSPLHHGALVRLTLNLDDDLYRAAKSMAIAQECSISAAVNHLLQRAINGSVKKQKKRNQFPVSKGRRPFSSEDVYELDQL